jgi:heme/copper-type cytochrome/quinol oxidase subunit 2
MRFEYSLTIKDLAESYQPFIPAAQAARLRRGLALWVAACFAATGLFVAANLWSAWHKRFSPPVEYPVQNLWVTLAPSLLPVSMMLTVMVTSFYRHYRRIRLTRKGTYSPANQPPAKLVGLLAVIPMVIFIVIPNVPAFELDWHPSPGTALWVGYTPWIFASMVGLLLGPLGRRRGAVQDWYRTRSLQRNYQLDINAEQLEIDTGSSHFRWKWNAIDRFRETKNLIVLITEDEQQLLVPKRAAEDPATLDALYALIQNSVSNGEFLAREVRFPVLPRPVIPLAA